MSFRMCKFFEIEIITFAFINKSINDNIYIIYTFNVAVVLIKKYMYNMQ